MKRTRSHTPNRRRIDRRGATMVEFAIVAPLVFTFFFAAFEFCRVAMIRHTADNAVYEACRVAIIPGATANEVRSEASRVLATVGINNVALSVDPSRIDRDTDEVTVRVRVPLDDNSFIPQQFFGGQTIVRELTLRREGI